jgi:hypothetical protein
MLKLFAPGVFQLSLRLSTPLHLCCLNLSFLNGSYFIFLLQGPRMGIIEVDAHTRQGRCLPVNFAWMPWACVLILMCLLARGLNAFQSWTECTLGVQITCCV